MALETRAEFLGHQIVAFCAFGGGFKLYIDGKVVDTARYREKRIAFLRGQIIEGDKTHIIEVFWTSSWREIKMTICVDGEQLETKNSG
jgi:hypothetical protein